MVVDCCLAADVVVVGVLCSSKDDQGGRILILLAAVQSVGNWNELTRTLGNSSSSNGCRNGNEQHMLRLNAIDGRSRMPF